LFNVLKKKSLKCGDKIQTSIYSGVDMNDATYLYEQMGVAKRDRIPVAIEESEHHLLIDEVLLSTEPNQYDTENGVFYTIRVKGVIF